MAHLGIPSYQITRSFDLHLRRFLYGGGRVEAEKRKKKKKKRGEGVDNYKALK